MCQTRVADIRAGLDDCRCQYHQMFRLHCRMPLPLLTLPRERGCAGAADCNPCILRSWAVENSTVDSDFRPDFMLNYGSLLPPMLADGVRIMLYIGLEVLPSCSKILGGKIQA